MTEAAFFESAEPIWNAWRNVVSHGKRQVWVRLTVKTKKQGKSTVLRPY